MNDMALTVLYTAEIETVRFILLSELRKKEENCEDWK